MLCTYICKTHTHRYIFYIHIFRYVYIYVYHMQLVKHYEYIWHVSKYALFFYVESFDFVIPLC